MKFSPFSLGILATVALAATDADAQNRSISTDLTNIAAAQNGGRILSTSSTLGNDKAYAASNLIDGKAFNFQNNTGSKGWASNQYDPINMDAVTIGFAGNQVRKIGKIVLNPSVDLTPERWAKDVEIQVSTESAEGPYQAIAQLTLKREATPQEFAVLPVNARFVRLMFRTNWGSDRAVGLGEVEIYEAIDDSDPMGGLITRLESALTDLRRYRQVQSEGTSTQTAAAAVEAPVQPAATRAPQRGARVQNTQLVTGTEATRFPTSNANIALAKNGGKIMAFSSFYNNDAAYGPDKLIDGQNYRPADDKGTNGWASQGFNPGKEFVTLGFADDRIKLLGRIVLNPTSNQSDLRWARRVEVQVTSGSFKDGPWKTAASINLRPEATNQDFVIRPVEAKYVRFVFQANGPGVVLPNADPNVNSDRAVSLGEIEIYEAVAGNDQLEALIGRFNNVLVDMKTLRRRQNDAGLVPDGEATPAKLRRAPAGKAGATAVKTAPKNAKKNVESAALKVVSTRKNG
ncbi:MAG TPA: discoidin domain-containing protein [Abditibacterium sp.]|jgi:hypothetical protein